MQKKSGFKINLATHIVAVIALVVGILTTIFAFGNLPEKNIEGGAVEGVYSPVADNTQEVVIEDVEFLGGETFLRVKKGTEYTVKNCTFNGATNAAIIVEGGVLNLVDCEIKNSTSNISVDMGGWSEIYNTAICVNGGILNLLGTTRISGVTNSQGIVLVSEVDGFELNTVLNLGTSVSGEGEWIGSISGCESAIYTLGAEVNMNSGTLTGNNYGVDVNWTDIETKININSGEISNNTQNGIQAYGYNATITINGGKISNHENGYGIYSDDSTVTLKGGEICGNAGGICMSDDDVLTMTGGEIHDNESTYGAGIYSGGQYVNVQISGGKIYNNKATYGGGVCLCGDGSNGSYLTITGGNIYNNTAENGGGVYIDGSNISESDVSHVINDGAIYGNTATNGGGIYLLSSSLTINGGLIGNDDETNSIAGNTATTGYGGGIYSSGSTITMNGGHIGENVVSGASVYGGGVYLCEASTMTMGEMAVIDSNKTTGTSSCGGGVSVDGKSTVTLSGTISNNYGKQNGGGIHLTGGSTCHLSGTQIVCNQTNFSSAATFGGGVYVVSGTLNLVKSTRQTLFEGNEAGCGGGIQFHNNGKLTCESGSSVKFLNNTAKSSGGAIRFYSKYDIDMDGFEFESNSANFGGAILINTAKYNGAVTINNSTFTENEAGESGGAIYMDSASYQSGIVAGDLTINGCSFSGNTAETSGTALYCNKQNTTLSGNTTISATTSQTVSLIHVSNTGKATFDSVLIDGNSTNAIAVDVHGASGTDNIAFGTGLEIRNFNGSAVKIAGGTQTLSYGYMHNNGIDLDISASANVTIGTESVSDSALSVKQDANGGSIVVSGATLTVNNLGSETSLDYGSAQEAFSSYSSTSFVKATNSATVNYNDSSRLVLPIYINASTLKFNGISESGIYLTNGSSCEYNGTINDEWDFGLLELNNSECTMMGGSITSDRGYIGVNLANNSTFTIAETATNAVIKKCAEGGIVSDGTSTIKLYNGKISDCGTKDNYLYGGIYSFGTVDVLGNVEISNCYAENGAGILVKNGTLNISAGVIKSNTASVYGGGIAVINGKLNMTGGEVSGNTAGSSDSGGGGGIYVSGTTANIKDSIIGGNTSNFHGGGIYSVSSTILTIESSIVGSDESKNIAGNTAVDTGGGIYHNNKKQLTLKGVNIQGNNAKNGGGIAIRSSGAMAFETLSDGTKNVITENEASQYGGGLFLRSSSNVELNENVEINENIAKFGGGIYVHTNNVLLTIDGAAINQNNAMTSGGGIYSSVANVTMNSGTISENSSVSQGGGIHILGESSDISATVLQLNGGAISENRADTGGGIYTKNATVNIGSIDDVSEILVGSNVGFTGGGGIYLGELSVLNMWGSEDVENSDPLYGFVSNKVDGYDSDGNFVARSEFFGRGAGVYIRNNSTFNMYSGYVAYNTIGSNVNRPIGAGMYIGANSTANLSGGTFLENVVQASTSHGVEIAVHQNNSALNISENARIIATSVEKHAIYNHGTLGIENGTFENVSVFNAGVATIAYTQSALSEIVSLGSLTLKNGISFNKATFVIGEDYVTDYSEAGFSNYPYNPSLNLVDIDTTKINPDLCFDWSDITSIVYDAGANDWFPEINHAFTQESEMLYCSLNSTYHAIFDDLVEILNKNNTHDMFVWGANEEGLRILKCETLTIKYNDEETNEPLTKEFCINPFETNKISVDNGTVSFVAGEKVTEIYTYNILWEYYYDVITVTTATDELVVVCNESGEIELTEYGDVTISIEPSSELQVYDGGGLALEQRIGWDYESKLTFELSDIAENATTGEYTQTVTVKYGSSILCNKVYTLPGEHCYINLEISLDGSKSYLSGGSYIHEDTNYISSITVDVMMPTFTLAVDYDQETIWSGEKLGVGNLTIEYSSSKFYVFLDEEQILYSEDGFVLGCFTIDGGAHFPNPDGSESTMTLSPKEGDTISIHINDPDVDVSTMFSDSFEEWAHTQSGEETMMTRGSIEYYHDYETYLVIVYSSVGFVLYTYSEIDDYFVLVENGWAFTSSWNDYPVEDYWGYEVDFHDIDEIVVTYNESQLENSIEASDFSGGEVDPREYSSLYMKDGVLYDEYTETYLSGWGVTYVQLAKYGDNSFRFDLHDYEDEIASYFPATIRLESNSDGLYHEEQVELDDSFDYYLIYSKNGFYVVKTRTDGLYVATVWFGLIDDGGNLQTNICEGMQIGQLNKIKINDLEFEITDDMEWGNDLFSYEYQTWAIIEESGTYYVCVYVNDNWQIFDDKWIVSKMSKEDWLEITIDYSSI